MYNEVIFVDFENFSKAVDSIKKTDAKVIVLAGVNQANKPFTFAKEILEKVSSVEILKVKGQGSNALDFFIAFYLGVYSNRNKNLKFSICSNDKGYDPLIKHLNENGINIKRIESENKLPKANESKSKPSAKTQKQQDLFETDKDFKKAFDNLKDRPANVRPRNLDKLEAHLKTIFRKTEKTEKIGKIINELVKRGFLEIEGKKIKYNL